MTICHARISFAIKSADEFFFIDLTHNELQLIVDAPVLALVALKAKCNHAVYDVKSGMDTTYALADHESIT